VAFSAPLNAGKLFARVKLLYNDTPQPIGVLTDGIFPAQGKRIISTGTSGSATRMIEVQQTFKDTMPFIDAGLYSGGNLEKN